MSESDALQLVEAQRNRDPGLAEFIQSITGETSLAYVKIALLWLENGSPDAVSLIVGFILRSFLSDDVNAVDRMRC